MARIARITASFLAVLAAYWVYAAVAVPLIEPTASRRAEAETGAGQRGSEDGRIDPRIAALEDLFPPDSWALKNPKILESDQFQLLMQDYRNLGDGRLELRPCAIILTPEGPAESEQQRLRRAIVLEAPEGAVLEFDRPLDLRRADVGEIVGGQLQGRITIRSRGESDGPEDALLVVTRDVTMTRSEVVTPHAVDFRFGPHHGRGRDLRIKLLEGELAGSDPTPSVSGIELFELRHVERLYLQLDRVAAARAARSDSERPDGDAADAADAAGAPGAEGLPVEITCEGPFRFDIPGKVASFEQQVQVLRLNPEGRDDRLDCDRLAIYFVERDRPAETTYRGGTRLVPTSQREYRPSLDLVPQRIEATGDPVTVSAPNQGVVARGRLLRYDLTDGRILLEDDREAVLRQRANEIHARRLVYQPDPSGGLARMAAEGPGWLRGDTADQPDDPLEVSWKKEARVWPDDSGQMVKVDGSAWLRFRGVGQLEAETVQFRFEQLPPASGQEEPRLRPRRMDASRDVRIRSPQLDGSVDELTVVFGELPPGAGSNWQPGTQTSQPRRRVRRDGGRPVELKPVVFREPGGASPSGSDLVGQPPPHAPAALPGPHAAAASPAAALGGMQQFEVSGKTLHARILLGEQTTRVAEVSVEGDARFAETQTRLPGERPVLVRGERIHVVDADTAGAAVTIAGEPAQFEGRGMAIEANHIHMNRGTNRLLIDGAGTMTLPLDRDLDGRPLPSATRLAIDWRQRMDFDGRTARFEDTVVARTPQQSLKTELLEVQFQQPIRFAEADVGEPPQAEQVFCRGGALMESRGTDGRQTTAHERMQARDLNVNLLSGDLTARGPGWLVSVRQAAADGPLVGRGGLPLVPDAPADDEAPLRQLYIRFQGGITGNVHHRELTFHDEVRTIYAPADSLQAPLPPDDPQALGPRGLVMNCNRLSVRQVLRPDGSQQAAEFEAAGNTIVESAVYTARAIRMTYSEAKDLLVLEGDGRSDAQLFRQQQIGGPMAHAAAQRILFWPGSNRLKVDGARSLELSHFQPGGR